MKAKVLPGGLKAQVENPYPKQVLISYEPRVWSINHDWKSFDDRNPCLPLTTPCEEGQIVECEVVWQVKLHSGWEPIEEIDRDEHAEYGRSFRCALKPIVQPITTKGKEGLIDKYKVDTDGILTGKQFVSTPSLSGSVDVV